MDFNLKKGNVAISWSGIQLDNISVLLPVFYGLCPYSPLSCRPLNTKCWFPSCFCADFSHPRWPDFWMQLICRPGQRLAAAALGVQLVSEQMGLSCTKFPVTLQSTWGLFSKNHHNPPGLLTYTLSSVYCQEPGNRMDSHSPVSHVKV